MLFKKIAKLRDDARPLLSLYGHISYKARASKQTFFSDLAWADDNDDGDDDDDDDDADALADR